MKDGKFALEDYIHFLKVERQLSQNTVTSYKRDLSDYLLQLEKAGLGSIDDIDRSAILTYLQSLKEQGKSTRTISRHISSIRSFHQFLLREKVASQDPTVHLEMPKLEQKLPSCPFRSRSGQIDIHAGKQQTAREKGYRIA